VASAAGAEPTSGGAKNKVEIRARERAPTDGPLSLPGLRPALFALPNVPNKETLHCPAPRGRF
jgi:hypothetical protein